MFIDRRSPIQIQSMVLLVQSILFKCSLIFRIFSVQCWLSALLRFFFFFSFLDVMGITLFPADAACLRGQKRFPLTKPLFFLVQKGVVRPKTSVLPLPQCLETQESRSCKYNYNSQSRLLIVAVSHFQFRQYAQVSLYWGGESQSH